MTKRFSSFGDCSVKVRDAFWQLEDGKKRLSKVKMKVHSPKFVTKWMSTASSGKSWEYGGGVCCKDTALTLNSYITAYFNQTYRFLYFPIRRNCYIDSPLWAFCLAAHLTKCSRSPLVSSILQSVTCPSTASHFTVNFIWIIFIHVLPLPHFRQKNTM